MIGLTSGVGNGGEDVVPLQERVVAEDLFERGAGGKKVQDVRDAHALPADARLAAALAGFDRDPLEQFSLHDRIVPAKATALHRTARGVGCERWEKQIGERLAAWYGR